MNTVVPSNSDDQLERPKQKRLNVRNEASLASKQLGPIRNAWQEQNPLTSLTVLLLRDGHSQADLGIPNADGELYEGKKKQLEMAEEYGRWASGLWPSATSNRRKYLKPVIARARLIADIAAKADAECVHQGIPIPFENKSVADAVSNLSTVTEKWPTAPAKGTTVPANTAKEKCEPLVTHLTHAESSARSRLLDDLADHLGQLREQAVFLLKPGSKTVPYGQFEHGGGI